MEIVKTPDLVKKYYRAPYRILGNYIWDIDNNMVIQAPFYNSSYLDLITNRLNGIFKPLVGEHNFTIKNGDVYDGDNKVLTIRSWGRLQYIKSDEPKLIQDTFGQYVVNLLNI